MGPLLTLLASLLLAVPRVEAAPSDASAVVDPLEARSASGLEILADVRPGQLHGQAIVVGFTVRNPTTVSLTFPDLATRPHLVRFDVTPLGGRLQSRFTTPPAQDTDVVWTLAPRGERQVLLEIPSSGAFKADQVELTIRVLNGEETVKLGPRTLALTWPDPAGAHVIPDTDVPEGSPWMSVWAHRVGPRADLYLDVRSSLDPNVSGDRWFLAHLDAPVTPRLSSSRPTESSDRHVYWRAGTRSLWYLRIHGTGARHAPRRTDLPWPSWDLLARGISDPEGGLHVPVWIPAPSGPAGEVRVISIDPQGTPYFRIVVNMPERPAAWGMADAGGQLRLLLLQGGKLDLYTLSTAPGATLPASGIRLLPPHVRKDPEAEATTAEAAPAAPPAPTIPPLPPTTGALFGMLPDTPEQPGGLAIFAWSEVGSAERRLSGAWLTLQGREIARIEGLILPKDAKVRTVIPAGYDPMLVVTTDAAGRGTVLGGTLKAPVSLGPVSPDEVIRPDGRGNLVRVAIRPRTGITTTRVAVPR